jgi:hypothetical protein
MNAPQSSRKYPIEIIIDLDALDSYTDEYLASLWHVAQIHPAPYGDLFACDIAETIGRAIIKRWLLATPAPLYTKQGRDTYFAERFKRDATDEAGTP